MERRYSATFTRHGHTKPIDDDDDQTETTIGCGKNTFDSESNEEKNKLLPIPHSTLNNTENLKLSKKDVTCRKCCQPNSAERGKALTPRDDIDTNTNVHVDIPVNNSIDEKELSAKKHNNAKRCTRCFPCIFSCILNGLMCVGLFVYLKYANITNKTEKENVIITNHVTTHKSMFENLKINFDSYNLQNNSGNIGWKLLAASFLEFDETGTNIRMRQPGSYSIDLTLNFDNRPNENQTSLYVCILNSGDNEYDSCTIEVLLAQTQKSVHVGINLNLQKGDAITVYVKGLNFIYQRSNVNHMTIRKYD